MLNNAVESDHIRKVYEPISEENKIKDTAAEE